MVQTLGVEFTDKELFCLLHILVRETGGSDQSETLPPVDGLSQTQDNQGYILYRDVYTLVRNYLRKEKIMKVSIRYGLEYQVLTKATFDFLLKFKQVLQGPEESSTMGKTGGSNDQQQRTSNDQERECKNFREAFAQQIQKKFVNTDVGIDLIEFDDFIATLFMKFKIRSPPKDTQEQLRMLLCVQLGPNVKEPSYFLVKKIERVLYDLDFVYVNLVKILREPNHEKLQQEAMKRLKQRYDFVARGISKTSGSDQTAKGGANQAGKGSTKQAKPRPMSSKPRKPQHSSSIEKDGSRQQPAGESYMQQTEDIVQEEVLDDDVDEDEEGIDDAVDDDYEEDVDTRGKYDRQKTKDIGFELPADDDEDDIDQDDMDDDIDDDYIDDDLEDEEAAVIGKGKTRAQMSDEEDDIADDYSDDADQAPVPVRQQQKQP